MKDSRLFMSVKTWLKRFIPISVIRWIRSILIWDRLIRRKSEYRKAYDLHRDDISNVVNYLEDDLSKETLDAYMKLMTHNHSKRLKLVTRPGNKQYFDDVITPANHEVFVDMGVCDGATSLQFAEWTANKYKSIILFEPDEACYKRSKENLVSLENTIMYNEGASDFCGKVYFTNLGTGESSISEKPTDYECMVSTLDSKMPEIGGAVPHMH